jgi:hypothetical protein
MADENPLTKGDIESMMQGFIAKQGGDYQRAAATLFDDNHKLREDKRKLTDEVESLKIRIPVDGSFILSAEQAKAWQAYRELGEDPKELKKKLETATTAEGELAKLRKSESLREAAEVEGFKASVLQRLGEDLEIEISDIDVVGVDGKVTQQKQARVKDGDKMIPLKEYANNKWTEFMPALKADTSSQTGQSTNGNNGQGSSNGTPYVKQGQGGGQGGNQDLVSNFITQANASRSSAPNPLAPPAASQSAQ